MFSGVERVFSDFDKFLEEALQETKLNGKRKFTKLSNLVQNFFEELSCLLNLDRKEYALGKMPWNFIFYNRMLSTQTALSQQMHSNYVETFQICKELFQDIPKKKPIYENLKTILRYLKHHETDPDNALIGLPPNSQIIERFEEWLKKPNDHFSRAESLRQSEEYISDERSLLSFDFPGKRGDLVVVKVDQSIFDVRRFKYDSNVNSNSAEEYVYKSSNPIKTSTENQPIFIARIKEAVECNKKMFLRLSLVPSEDEDITVPSIFCLPFDTLVPRSHWMGNVQKMRESVGDPYKTLYDNVTKGILSIFENYFSVYNVECTMLFHALQIQPVSFFYYHRLRDAQSLFESMALSDDDKEKSKYKELTNQKEEIFAKIGEFCQNELTRFLDKVLNSKELVNHLFMPTSEQDLLKLKGSIKPKVIAMNILQELDSKTKTSMQAMKGEKRELMNGNLKNQLSKWWLLLIKTRTDIILTEAGYDFQAFNSDTYIDESPPSIEKVKENLAIVQDILNPKHEMHEKVYSATNDVKNEVYPVIDDFILKAHVVLSQKLLKQKLPLEYTPDSFPMHDILQKFAEKKENFAPDKAKELDDLIKDLEYLVEMKELEAKTKGNKEEGTQKKLSLSKAVPLSGLMMGSFFRLENMLKTAIELWDKPIPIVETPTEIPLNNHEPVADIENHCEKPEKKKNLLSGTLRSHSSKKDKNHHIDHVATLRSSKNKGEKAEKSEVKRLAKSSDKKKISTLRNSKSPDLSDL